MQPDPIRVEETLAWMKKSRKDLWRAESGRANHSSGRPAVIVDRPNRLE
jgi:hypothetical protein